MSRGRKLKIGDVVSLRADTVRDGTLEDAPFLMTVEIVPARAGHASRYGVVWMKPCGELQRAELFRGILHLWENAKKP